jgi:4-amino-4-deoxy-L-arabinose transferase-like glycosyltransferase
MHLTDKHSIHKIQIFAGATGLFFLLVAYLSHLGFIPLHNSHDEARRALVSAEMMLSGDYLTPALNGEIYLNKPPLYNWIITGYFKLFGDWSMFVFRLQVIVAILLTGAITFHFVKKYTNQTIAFFTAFAYITNGRLLIYDSFLGLIDTTFSMLVYLSFMLTWHYGEKKKYLPLFLSTYLITALAFLMKAFPALAFQGLTLLTYFIWRKKFKVLFYASHFAGLALFFIITGGYYLAYFAKNDIAPVVVFSNLLNESSKRTVVQFGIGKTLLHFFSFPFEMLYHYAPWTLFILVIIQKNIRKLIKTNDFIVYSFLVLIINLLIYWTSPQVYARFLFMFLPLLYSVLFYVFFEFIKESSWQYKFIRFLLISFSGLLLITFLVLPFLKVVKEPSFIYLKCFSLAFVFAALLWMMIKYSALYLYAVVLVVIFFRIGFNWFIMEPRAGQFKEVEDLSEKIVQITKGEKLYLLEGAQTGNFDGMSFHIATRRNEVLKFNNGAEKESFFIADRDQLEGKKYTSYLTFINDVSDSLKLVKFNRED